MLRPRDRRTLGRWSRPLLAALVAFGVSVALTSLLRPLDDPAPKADPAADVSLPEPARAAPAEAPAAPGPASEPATRAARVRAVFGGDPTAPAGPPPSSPAPRPSSEPDAGSAPEVSPAAPDADTGDAPEAVDAGAIRGIWPTDADGIRSAVREALPDLRQCYAAWLQAHPDLGGTVKASFTITADADGAEAGVTEVHLQESTVGQPFLEGCVLNVLSALRFEPPPDGPVTVTYPFVLRADTQPP